MDRFLYIYLSRTHIPLSQYFVDVFKICIGAWAVRAPFATGVITAGVQTTAADAFAQLVVEKREKIDWRRNAIFTGFGIFYVGGFQYYLYSVKFKQWCGWITKSSGHIGAAPVKVWKLK